MDNVIDRDIKILGGTPVFPETRVPVRTLIEYPAAGDRLDDFPDSHTTMSRAPAVAVFEQAKGMIARIFSGATE